MDSTATTGFSQFGANAVPLPLWALLPLTLLSALPLLFAWRAMPSSVARFVIVAVWLRIVFDGWAFVTLRSFGGLKPITLLSIGTVAVGLLVLDLRAWLMKAMLPFYALFLLFFVSSVLNHAPGGFLDPTIRLIYLALIMLAAVVAMRIEGTARFSTWLAFAFGPAFLLQAGSIVLGVRRFTERDGSSAWIGGFGHESAFSLLVIASLIVVRFATRLGLWTRLALVLLACVSLLLANYRTAIIAAAPLIAWQLTELLLLGLSRRLRAAALVVLAVLGVGVVGAGVVNAGDRYTDAFALAQNVGAFMREPDSFTRAEQQAASGRTYLWSQYYHGWSEAKPLQRAIGRGPDSWTTTFRVYAQNTLLSYLYEVGIAGVALLLLLWLVMIGFAARAPWPDNGYLLAAHLTFVLLNMSTMPFEMVDGLVLVALLYGYTLHASYARTPGPVERARRSPHDLLPYGRLSAR